MKLKTKYKIILAIFIISLISSIIIGFAPLSKEGFCGSNPEEGCGAVQNSKYAEIFGISNGVFGTVIFAFLTILTISYLRKPDSEKRKIITYGILLGAITAIYFLFLQAFIIKEFCKFCLVIDIGMIIAFFLMIPKKKKFI